MSEAFGANLNPVNQEEDRKKLRSKQRDFVKALFPKGVPETIDETSKKILAKVGEFTTFAEMNLFEQRVTETFKLASKEGRTLTSTEIYQALGMPRDFL